RHAERPTAKDYIPRFSDSFVELRGDRSGGDDSTVVCGIGMLGAESVMYAGLQRRAAGQGDGLTPAGLRKARRAYQLAARLRLPVVTLIDGVSLSPAIDAEEHGLAAALADCLA